MGRPARYRYCRCGTHLAADNKERQCARCQRAARDKLIAPPQVPPEFWQTEQFRDAFAAQYIGRVAHAYRLPPIPPHGLRPQLHLPKRCSASGWVCDNHKSAGSRPGHQSATSIPWLTGRGYCGYPPGLLWFDLPAGRRRTATDASIVSSATYWSRERVTLWITSDWAPQASRCRGSAWA